MVSDLHGVDAVIAQKVVDVLFARGTWQGTERVDVLDEIGIDFQFSLMNGGHTPYVQFIVARNPVTALEALAASNTWSAEAIEGHTDRLSFATPGRRRESSTGLSRRSPAPHARKPNGADQDRPRRREVDRASRLRPLLVGGHRPRHGRDDPHRHVTHVLDPGWDNNGGDVHHTSLLHFSQNHQVPQVALAALIFGGVFERHPHLPRRRGRARPRVAAVVARTWSTAWPGRAVRPPTSSAPTGTRCSRASTSHSPYGCRR